MGRLVHLSKAPIVEAIIDFGVVPRPDASVNELDAIRQKIGNGTADWEPLYQLSAKVTFDAKAGTTKEKIERKSHTGYRSRPTGDGRLMSITLDGISYHKLKPYTSWDDIFGKAWESWVVYREEFRPERMRRFAARYINRLELPFPDNLEDYLQGPPPARIGYSIGGYVKRLSLVDNETKLSCNVIEILEVPEGTIERKIVIILDNDIYTTKTFGLDDDSSIQGVFESIHELKNRLFEEAVSPRVLEYYK